MSAPQTSRWPLAITRWSRKLTANGQCLPRAESRGPTAKLPAAVGLGLVAISLLFWHVVSVEEREYWWLAEAVLALGLLMAGTLSVTVGVAQQARRRSRQFQAANFLLQAQIAERHRAEQELIRLNRSLGAQQHYVRSLIEASLDPLVTISNDGKIMDVNRATEAVTGVEREKLIGSDFCDYFSEPEKARQGYAEVFAQGLVRDYPLAIRHLSGSLTDVLYNATVFKNEAGEIEGIFAAARDITERKRAERRLYDQQFYTRSLIEASLDPLMVLSVVEGTDSEACPERSRRGIITDVNQQMEWLTGCVRADLIGSEFKQYCTEPERAEEGIRRVLREGKLRDYELTVRRRAPIGSSDHRAIGSSHPHFRAPDGPIARSPDQETVVSYNATIFRDWEGKVAGVFASARDITERKRAERELQRFASELARSNADLQDFASIASHDLQEPLRKVLAFGDQLQEHCREQLDDLGRDFLGRMQNAALRMSNLINGLLQYSRVSSRAQPFEPVDLQQVVAEIVLDLEAQIQDAKARVEVGPLPRLLADRTQMRQLMQNLLSNAIKFHCPATAPRVAIASQLVNDRWWEITVRDDGIGFDEKYLQRIFRPFQRLHGRDEYPGSGMGLAICRKIVDRHGGDLTAHSQPGHGASFVLTLPAVAGTTRTAEDAKARRGAQIP